MLSCCVTLIGLASGSELWSSERLMSFKDLRMPGVKYLGGLELCSCGLSFYMSGTSPSVNPVLIFFLLSLVREAFLIMGG